MLAVLFACSLLTCTAITPLAAKRTLTSLFVTIASETLWPSSETRVSCLRYSRKGAFWATRRSLDADLETSPSLVGRSPRDWPSTSVSLRRSPSETCVVSSLLTNPEAGNTRSTTLVSSGPLSGFVLLPWRRLEGSARRASRFCGSFGGLQHGSRTRSCAFTREGRGLGCRATCRLRLHRRSCTGSRLAVTHPLSEHLEVSVVNVVPRRRSCRALFLPALVLLSRFLHTVTQDRRDLVSR